MPEYILIRKQSENELGSRVNGIWCGSSRREQKWVCRAGYGQRDSVTGRNGNYNVNLKISDFIN